MNVKSVMTHKVISVQQQTPLKEVARILSANRISGVPVVDGGGGVVGVVSEADFLLKERGAPDERGFLHWLMGDGAEEQRIRDKVVATTAGEAMTTPAITIDARAPVRAAAATMLEHRVNRLPVVEEGSLIGIVTRADLCRAFVRTDLELATEVRDRVGRRAGWVDLDDISVNVEQGIAQLGGRVHRRSIAVLLEQVASEVDGILAVDSHVRWDVDDRALAAAVEEAGEI